MYKNMCNTFCLLIFTQFMPLLLFFIEMMVSNQLKRLLELIMLNKDDHLADYLLMSSQQTPQEVVSPSSWHKAVLSFLFDTVKEKRLK